MCLKSISTQTNTCLSCPGPNHITVGSSKLDTTKRKKRKKKKDSATVRLLVFEQKEEYQQVQNGIKHWLTHFTL